VGQWLDVPRQVTRKRAEQACATSGLTGPRGEFDTARLAEPTQPRVVNQVALPGTELAFAFFPSGRRDVEAATANLANAFVHDKMAFRHDDPFAEGHCV
jgi:hypothetical protein